eukprot:2648691-Amphidinium_carterae.1
MLKAWVVFGCSVESKSTHMKETWQCIKSMQKEGGLPDEDFLDRNAVQDWSSYECVPAADSDLIEVGERPNHPRTGSTASLLGRAASHVPATVHATMEAMARNGALPITTLEQRMASQKPMQMQDATTTSIQTYPPCLTTFGGSFLEQCGSSVGRVVEKCESTSAMQANMRINRSLPSEILRGATNISDSSDLW